jgi:methylated-DNA-protein-cysteine methyltransferase-like protein
MKKVQESASPDGSKRPEQSPAQRIETAIARIPRGCVASYGQVASMAGLPGRARLVARVLRTTSLPLPWHRVLRSDGSIAFASGSNAQREQRQRLLDEGVDFQRTRVNLRLAAFDPMAELIARELLGLDADDAL